MKRRSFLQSAVSLAAASALPLRYVRAGDTIKNDLPAVTLDGKAVVLKRSDLETLKADFRGVLLLPEHDQYDIYRRLWNGMFDKHPALIARCGATPDVVKAVNFAREFELLTAVRCGGHSFSGKSTCDGGLMIDLTLMKNVEVDPAARTVRIGGGVLLGEMDATTQAHGLATTAGTVSHTGAGGLTLGGGYGRMSRKYGLACDNLIEAEVVTADGKVLTASEEENPDLFWGIRGGGGNFGVVTAFTFRLHDIGPIVYGGNLSFAFKDAREVMNFYSGFAHESPGEVFGGAGFFVTPNGEPVFGMAYNYCGDPKQGEKALEPLRKFRTPLSDSCQATPYLVLQTRSDGNWPAGRNYYMKSGFTGKIEPAVIDEVIDYYSHKPDPMVGTFFYQVGGAANTIAKDATAYWQRDAEFDLITFAGWDGGNKNEDAEVIEKVRAHWRKLEPYAEGLYLNSAGEDEHVPGRMRQVFGGNYQKLARIKTKYDPANLFRLNSNIKPG